MKVIKNDDENNEIFNPSSGCFSCQDNFSKQDEKGFKTRNRNGVEFFPLKQNFYAILNQVNEICVLQMCNSMYSNLSDEEEQHL